LHNNDTTTIRKVFLLISETLPAASVCLIWIVLAA
jgi:hypothetical protein